MGFSTDIVNTFQEDFYWNILLQGGFLTICLVAGVYILLVNHEKSFFKKPKDGFSLSRYLNELKDFATNIYRTITSRELLDLEAPEAPEAPEVPEAGESVENTHQRSFFSGSSILTLVVGFVLIFTLGTIGNVIADDFMDKGPDYHLGLKKLWVSDNSEDSDTDKVIKLHSYDKIFNSVGGVDKNATDTEKLQVYYSLKHFLLKDELWRGYLNYSQNFINISQVFSLGFFLFFVLVSVNFYLLVARLIAVKLTSNKKRKWGFTIIIFGVTMYFLIKLAAILPFDYRGCVLFFPIIYLLLFSFKKWGMPKILPSFLLMIFAVLGYWGAAASWHKNEEEICMKTYGVYKAENSLLRKLELNILGEDIITGEKAADDTQ